MKNANILLVEDDSDLQFLMNKKLTDEGFAVTALSTGQQALDHLEKNKPDVVLLDIMLPDIDGVTVLTEISKNPKLNDMPVIILSNLADKGSFEQVSSVGNYEYLIKAKTDLSELVKHVRAKLEK